MGLKKLVLILYRSKYVMDNTPYQYGRNAELIAFYQVNDSTIPAHTDIPMYTTHFSIQG